MTSNLNSRRVTDTSIRGTMSACALTACQPLINRIEIILLMIILTEVWRHFCSWDIKNEPCQIAVGAKPRILVLSRRMEVLSGPVRNKQPDSLRNSSPKHTDSVIIYSNLHAVIFHEKHESKKFGVSRIFWCFWKEDSSAYQGCIYLIKNAENVKLWKIITI